MTGKRRRILERRGRDAMPFGQFQKQRGGQPRSDPVSDRDVTIRAGKCPAERVLFFLFNKLAPLFFCLFTKFFARFNSRDCLLAYGFESNRREGLGGLISCNVIARPRFALCKQQARSVAQIVCADAGGPCSAHGDLRNLRCHTDDRTK